MSPYYSQSPQVATDLTLTAPAPTKNALAGFEPARGSFRSYTKDRPCPVCGGHDGCKEASAGLILCRKADGSIPGFRYTGRTSSGVWAKYWLSDEARASYKTIYREPIAPKVDDRLKTHQKYQNLYSQLSPLTKQQRQRLLDKGLTEQEIEAGQFRNLEKKRYQGVDDVPGFINGIPKVYGVLTPVFDINGLYRVPEIYTGWEGKKYLPLSTQEHQYKLYHDKRPNQYLNRDSDTKCARLVEGLGIKPTILARRMPNDLVVGGGGSATFDDVEMHRVFQLKGINKIVFYPDAGSFAQRETKGGVGDVSPNVVSSIQNLIWFARKYGYELTFANWGQLTAKAGEDTATKGDVDEINDETFNDIVEIDSATLFGIHAQAAAKFEHEFMSGFDTDGLKVIEQRFLDPALNEYKAGCIHWYKSPMFTGKTSNGIYPLLRRVAAQNEGLPPQDKKRVLVVLCRVTLCESYTSSFAKTGIEFWNDTKNPNATMLAICVDSLYKLGNELANFDIIVFDEFSQTLSHAQIGSTCRKRRAPVRAALTQAICYTIAKGGQIHIFDADMTRREQRFMKGVLGDAYRPTGYLNTVVIPRGEYRFVDETALAWVVIKKLRKLQEMWYANNKTLPSDYTIPLYFTESIRDSEKLKTMLENELDPEFLAACLIALFNSKTASDPETRKQLELLSKDPEQFKKTYQPIVIIGSPTISNGYNINANYIDTVCGRSSTVLGTNAFMQGLRRARLAIATFITLPRTRIRDYASNPQTAKKYLERQFKLTRYKTQNIDREAIDYKSAYLDLDPMVEFNEDLVKRLSGALDPDSLVTPHTTYAAQAIAYENWDLAFKSDNIKQRLESTGYTHNPSLGDDLFEDYDKDENKEAARVAKAKNIQADTDLRLKFIQESKMSREDASKILDSHEASHSKQEEARAVINRDDYPGFVWTEETVKQYLIKNDRKLVTARYALLVKNNSELARQNNLRSWAYQSARQTFNNQGSLNDLDFRFDRIKLVWDLLGDLEPGALITDEAIGQVYERYRALSSAPRTLVGVSVIKKDKADWFTRLAAVVGYSVRKPRKGDWTLYIDPVLLELASCYQKGLEAKAAAECPHFKFADLSAAEINEIRDDVASDPPSAWDILLAKFDDRRAYDDRTVFEVLDRLPKDSKILQLGKRLKIDRPDLYAQAGRTIQNRFLGA